MEMVYNELSASPLSVNRSIADQKMARFIQTYKKGRDKGFLRIRFEYNLHEIALADGYTMQQWLSGTNRRNLKDLLLAARTYPFIDDNDEEEIEQYLSHRYFFEDSRNGIERTECLGLAAAHIYETLSISLSGSTVWENNLLSITKANDGTLAIEVVAVVNVFSPECLDRQEIQVYIENIGEVELVETELLPRVKNIHFRDDHGTDVLRAFANRLVNSRHVLAIINSLPFNREVSRLIKKVNPDGKIEIVLHWDDRGLGMVIQTTGRNMRETRRIAELIEDEYDE
ncbi:MAG: hypothetical protein HQL08_01805 [Nitrospirae bacterium]|nr:hypothetical protein [Nitrospirota bacterium]